jgi:hypothetical protein
VYEMFDMNTDLEHAILDGKGEDDLFAIVRKEGMLTMKEDAIIKSAEGIVPFEEVNSLGGEFELDDTPEAAPAPAPIKLGEGVEPEEEEAAPEPPEKELKV